MTLPYALPLREPYKRNVSREIPSSAPEALRSPPTIQLSTVNPRIQLSPTPRTDVHHAYHGFLSQGPCRRNTRPAREKINATFLCLRESLVLQPGQE